MHFNLLSHVCSSRWDIAFIDEKLDDILSLNSIQFKIPTNPYAGKQWFADPFILDVTDDKIYLLVEEMHSDLNKGRIAKLTIEKDKWLISKVDILLEEPWHLSFPFIIRKNGKIYVAPESAKAGAWYLYELITDENGNEKLRRIKQLCDKVVWDSIITECFNEPLMLTCCQNDFYLDIFKKNTEDDAIYSYHESIRSKTNKQNMRMAGDIFKIGDDIFCPSQVSSPWTYGENVEIKRVKYEDGNWEFDTLRKILPPKSLLNDGLHTFNTYKGAIVVDIHKQNGLLSLFINFLVKLKKKFLRRVL